LQRCSYSIKVMKGSIITSASAPSAEVASRLAAGYLIIRLHHKNLLTDLFTGPDDPSEEQLKAPHSTIEFVYNHCAKILTIPQVNVRNPPLFLGRRFEVSIELPECGIHVKSNSRTCRQAEAVACLRFKAAMDEYFEHTHRDELREAGERFMTGTDFAGLSTANAMTFLGYFHKKRVRKDPSSSFILQPWKAIGGFWRTGTAPCRSHFTLEGQAVGEPVVFPCPQRELVRRVTALAAAITLVKRDLALLQEFVEAKGGSVVTPVKPLRPITPVIKKEGEQAMVEAARQLLLQEFAEAKRGSVVTPVKPLRPITPVIKKEVERAMVEAARQLLLQEFVEAKRGSVVTPVKPLRPITLVIENEVEQAMVEAACQFSWSSVTQESIGLELPEDEATVSRCLDEMGEESVEFGIKIEDTNFEEILDRGRKPRTEFRLDLENIKERNEILKQRQFTFSLNTKTESFKSQKADLPMTQFRAKVKDIVANHQSCIILGATGSGKTTQVPQIILEDGIADGIGGNINIICTQPRRIAAVTVARRVASERNESVGNTVGYHIKHERRLPRPGGSITYCTTGVLLRQLQHGSDEILDTTSHIIIDEVHERDLQTDFLLTILKQTLDSRRKAQKPVPKLVLMSATVDPALFSEYLEIAGDHGENMPCPWLEVPGRTFPVMEIFLDDLKEQLVKSHSKAELDFLTDRETSKYEEAERLFEIAPLETLEATEIIVPLNLMAATIAHLAKTTPSDGAILAFLPGMAEINALNLFLLGERPLGVNFTDTSKFKICLVHSGLPAKQWEAFACVPAGCRKIIIATNIAETSITIPEVQHVVDSGKHREIGYHHASKATSLSTVWISKSSAKQRAGRAGRVRKGNYYAIYSRARHDSLKAVQTPEIHRVDLQEVCLQIKKQSFQFPIRDFLAGAPEPPLASAVDSAIEALQQLDALDADEQLTGLGHVLSTLPLHPSLGKMVVLGITFRCFDALLLLSAATEGNGLFYRRGSKEQRLRLSLNSQSDHITTINAFRKARRLRDLEGAYQAFYNCETLACINPDEFDAIDQTMRNVEDKLISTGLLPYPEPSGILDSQRGSPSLNENSENIALIKALALSCFPGQISAVISTRLSRTRSEPTAMISPQSINGVQGKEVPRYKPGDLHLYTEITKMDQGTKILRDTSEVSPLMVALFGGPLTHDKIQGTSIRNSTLRVDGWIPLAVSGKAAYTLLEFRRCLDKFISTWFRNLIRARGAGSKNHELDFEVMESARTHLVDGLVKVLQLDEEARMKKEHMLMSEHAPSMDADLLRPDRRAKFISIMLGK
jgi:HrpA-like RNA helicase